VRVLARFAGLEVLRLLGRLLFALWLRESETQWIEWERSVES
jgi:hypothetical protein